MPYHNEQHASPRRSGKKWDDEPRRLQDGKITVNAITYQYALSVATAIAGQFMKYLWSFKPARDPGSGTPSEPLPHTAHGVGASRRAPKRARETTAPRVSASVHAPNPALFNSHEPPSDFERDLVERMRTMLTACIWVGVALCTRP